MDFHTRLYDLRKRAGLSQEELANLVGVTRQAVQKWEAMAQAMVQAGVPGWVREILLFCVGK